MVNSQETEETETLDLRTALRKNRLDMVTFYSGDEPKSIIFLDGQEVAEEDLPAIFGYKDRESLNGDWIRMGKEESVFRTSDASGGIDHYAQCLGYPRTESFIGELTGKRILDLGSGRGLLAREAYLRGLDLEVYSVEPKLSLKGYRARIGELSKEFLSSYQPPRESPLGSLRRKTRGAPKKDLLEEASKHHDRIAVAAMAHALPFGDNFFDFALDVTAVSRYTGRHDSHGGHEEEPIFRLYFQEAMRVLKPGGKLKIFDPTAYGWVEKGYSDNPSWKEQVVKDLGLESSIIWEPGKEGKEPLGIEIIKEQVASGEGKS